MEITFVRKRNFSTKKFHLDKISEAVTKAMKAVGNGTEENAVDVALAVYKTLSGWYVKKTFSHFLCFLSCNRLILMSRSYNLFVSF